MHALLRKACKMVVGIPQRKWPRGSPVFIDGRIPLRSTLQNKSEDVD
jgi:hypothetical protein